MSDDPEQQHFTDGITDDIITDLAKIGGLAVVARNSAFTYKNRAVKIPDVGRELGVRYVLEGSVRKVGDQFVSPPSLLMPSLGITSGRSAMIVI
jgi:adenylate cyclase